jgi:hypothetical protein
MLREVSETDFDRRPSADKWSAGEVADHLIKSNRLYFGEINKLVELKLAGKEPRIVVRISEMDFDVPFVPRILTPFLDLPVALFNRFVPSGAREFLLSRPVVPFKAPPQLKPEARRGKTRLLAELEEELRRTERLFADNAQIAFDELKYYHPVFGFNGVDDILGLLISHEERHQKQLSTISRSNATTKSNHPRPSMAVTDAAQRTHRDA